MSETIKPFSKLLIANRGEIAIRIARAASELHIKTVAVYTYEDRYSLHRYKTDEAYQIGKEDDPLKPYLDIDEIIKLAKLKGVEAIHPGYGFLSENVDFAKRCEEEGITFIGPSSKVMSQLGNKVSAKEIAKAVNVPIIESNENPLNTFEEAKASATKIGYPIILKAAAGGGGRGMRVVRDDNALKTAFEEAKREAGRAFGNDTIFIEKFVADPKHLEVQIMADNHGNIVHLYERDCSVQRRFQKVVEIAPSIGLKEETKQKLFSYALAIAQKVNYNNVGTVEFLVNPNEEVYFIEVNPRVQVEHTVTEEVTGIDIVRSQILIAQGHQLSDSCIYIKSQNDVHLEGYAIQCRVTTEDPANGFQPDYGKIIAYRNAGGFGIRLDEGSSYSGVTISPFFDSLLVKITASGRTLWGAADRLYRTLQEFRIRGVKTNIGFLENVISHEVLQKGKATVNFIDEHPELFEMRRRLDRGTKILNYLANVTVNGNPDVKSIDTTKIFEPAIIPSYDKFESHPKGTKQKLDELGANAFSEWLKNEKSIHYTDTTFRDAHQSLLATRARSIDMLKVAESFAKNHPNLFSMEVWGGATFDVALRFLNECPWQRLQKLRKAIPNILLQMLIRGSNAVGYTAYPDNLIQEFIVKAWENGVDVFRIFDSLNWVEAMKVSIKTVREQTNGLAEACICYTGDITNPDKTKYTLQYYLDLAKQLEDEGAHILAIKDMAGLLRPLAAEKLITELKQVISIPIHLHTHDTSAVQCSTYYQAIEAGVDIVDVALSSMSGLTSQPNFNSLVAAMQGHERELPVDLNKLNEFSNYWEKVRQKYYPFESGLQAGTAEVYDHEIPGGQYSNLRPQAIALGLEDKFETIKKNYKAANLLMGDIVKVTPSSKVVGDLAMFMTSNDLTYDDVLEQMDQLSFPDSLKGFMRGDLGQPYQGFPEKFQKSVLKGEEPYTDKPNQHLEPIQFEDAFYEFQKEFDSHCSFLDFLSYQFYPKVFDQYYDSVQKYGDISVLPTEVFFYGLKENQEVLIEISPGKTIVVKLSFVSSPNEEGIRNVVFKLNGQTRTIEVKDLSVQTTVKAHQKISNPESEIAAQLQGKLSKIIVKEGQSVDKDKPLFIIEAMKMETTITAPQNIKVGKIHIEEGSIVEQDDLIISYENTSETTETVESSTAANSV